MTAPSCTNSHRYVVVTQTFRKKCTCSMPHPSPNPISWHTFQDLADEETNTPSVQKKVDPKAADEAAKKALAAADDVLKSVSGDPAAISIPPEAEQSEYFKQLVEAEKRREKDKADREQVRDFISWLFQVKVHICFLLVGCFGLGNS